MWENQSRSMAGVTPARGRWSMTAATAVRVPLDAGEPRGGAVAQRVEHGTRGRDHEHGSLPRIRWRFL
ncbi:hypothetical protein Acsp06_01750 [Actinomycetospora sp. NBRC 106375]|nr:hypothetical protein Acsp06_01750 [Actinomycetospora sp. NBRC 106375]